MYINARLENPADYDDSMDLHSEFIFNAINCIQTDVDRILYHY